MTGGPGCGGIPAWPDVGASVLRRLTGVEDRLSSLEARCAAKEPATDAALIEARKIVARSFTAEEAQRIIAGSVDDGHRVKIALAAIKRGMEMSK